MDKRGKNKIETPQWAQTGLFRFIRLDAGPLQVAKAFLSGWEYISSPRAIHACSEFYNDETIHLLKVANFNWISVTWSVGFSLKEESAQQKMLKDFIIKCHEQGIKVSAYLTIANMFWENLFADEPQSKNWVQIQFDGSPVLNLGHEKRYLACLNNPDWMDNIKIRLDSALEADVDGLHLDDLFSSCYCDICREKFRNYSAEVLGRSYDIPHPSPNEVEHGVRESESGKAFKVWGQFSKKTLSDAMVNIGRWVFHKKPNLVLSCNAQEFPPIDDACNALWVEGGKTPGQWDGESVSNAGFYRHIHAIAAGRKPVLIDKVQSNQDKKDRFTPMSLDAYHLSSAEAVAFQVNLVFGLEGHFLTGLYFKERKALNLWKGIGMYNQFMRDYEEYIVDSESTAQVDVLLRDKDNEKVWDDILCRKDNLQGDRSLRLQTPKPVAGCLLKQEKRDRMVLHLLNYSQITRENVNIRVGLPQGLIKEPKVFLVSPDQLGVRAFLPAQWNNDRVEFTVPELSIYAMVVIGGELGALPKVASV